MTFSAVIEADRLGSLLESVSVLVDECKIHPEDDGLEIRAVGPANVGMVDVSLDAGAFESYETTGGLIGVELEAIENVVGMAESGDLVHLDLDEETRKLEIEIEGLEYTLALIDPEAIRQEPDIPDLDLAATYVFEGDELDRGVRAADLCSDHIAIEGVADDELRFDAESDTDDVEVTVSERDLLSGMLDEDVVSSACRSLFSLDYLQDMTKPIGSDAEVSLRVGEEMPVKLRYSRCDGDLSVTNLLAPRISSED